MAESSGLSLPVRRPVAVLMVAVAVVVFGYVSYQRLSLNLMPDITYPTLTVRTEYPGNAPEEVELAISRPLEEALGVVNNLVSISSISRSGMSDIIIEYEWDTDMNTATQDIREKIDQVFLPEEADRPIILRYDPTLDPILRVGIYGGDNLFFLRRIAEDEFKRKLEQTPGVAAVKVKGGYEDEILVEVDQGALDRLNLTIEEINRRLSSENINIAGGNLKEGDTEYVVRTLNQFATVEEIGDIAVANRNGVEIYLRDIGEVRKAPKELEVISRVNGELSAEIEIYKEADANLVAVAEVARSAIFGTAEQQAYAAGLKKGVERKEKVDIKRKKKGGKRGRRGGGGGVIMRHQEMTDFLVYDLPKDIKADVLSDQSIFIQKSISEVRNTAILGGVLAIFILFFFLRNVVSTLIVGVAIPISIIATFAPMHIFLVTVNIMSLGGLALGVGMLVDNSIVVLESIFRCREEGDDLVDAAVRGTKEVRSAVAASTLTTIAVFFPIVFVKGVAGQIFGDLALTVVFSLLASLAVAVYMIPMLASRDFRGKYSSMQRLKLKDLLRFSFWRNFRKSLRGVWTIVRRGKFVWKWMKTIFFLPIALLYLLFRLILELALNLIGKIILIISGLVVFTIKLLMKVIGFVLKWLMKPLIYSFNKAFGWLNSYYPRLLNGALDNKWSVLGVSFAMFAFCYFVMVPNIGRELIPQVHQGEFNLEFTLPVGTPIENTAARIDTVERMAALLPGSRMVSAVYGAEKTSIRSSEEGENFGRVTVLLTPGGDLADREEAFIERLRLKITHIPDLYPNVTRPVLFTFKTPVEVEIQGYNLDELRAVADEAVKRMEGVGGIRDVRSNIRRGNPEVQLKYNRERLAMLGLNIFQVATIVRNKVQGEVNTQFYHADRKIDIRVRLDENDRASLQDISRIVVNPEGEIPELVLIY